MASTGIKTIRRYILECSASEMAAIDAAIQFTLENGDAPSICFKERFCDAEAWLVELDNVRSDLLEIMDQAHLDDSYS